jgi:hypothetical protein
MKIKSALVFACIMSVSLSSFFGQIINNNPDSNIIFTFEVVRHGARAPLIKAENSHFPVPE